jgi:hypothetical protein
MCLVFFQPSVDWMAEIVQVTHVRQLVHHSGWRVAGLSWDWPAPLAVVLLLLLLLLLVVCRHWC